MHSLSAAYKQREVQLEDRCGNWEIPKRQGRGKQNDQFFSTDKLYHYCDKVLIFK